MLRRRLLLTAAAAALPLALTHSIPASARAEARTLALQEHAQPGDLVFRVGTSPESLAVRSVSHRALSHVGVAVNAGGAVAVVHATPADARSAGGVIVSSWSDYGVGDHVEGVHLYRIKHLTSAERDHVLSAALSLLGAHSFASLRQTARSIARCWPFAPAGVRIAPSSPTCARALWRCSTSPSTSPRPCYRGRAWWLRRRLPFDGPAVAWTVRTFRGRHPGMRG